jgi:hypothetical protein
MSYIIFVLYSFVIYDNLILQNVGVYFVFPSYLISLAT